MAPSDAKTPASRPKRRFLFSKKGACCEVGDHPLKKDPLTLTVALAGNPNSGKTTVFNALTGLRQKVANYPGVTVEKKTGRCRLPPVAGKPARFAHIIDLPGTYSLISHSPDERVAMEVLRGLRPDTPAPDVVIVVVDASNLQRNLYLVSQLIETGRPLVIALNMMDIARRRGMAIAPERLEKQLGVPVVPVVGYKGEGIPELKAAILHARVAPMPDWQLPPAMRAELQSLGNHLSAHAPYPLNHHAAAIAERLLVGDPASDLLQFSRHESVGREISGAAQRLERLGIDPMQADIEAHYHWIDAVAAASLAPPAQGENAAADPSGPPARQRPLSDRMDAILIHKVWGLAIFAFLMALIFVAIFWLAQPLMNATNNSIQWLGHLVTGPLGNGPLKSLLNDGVFAGTGTVLSFVPQIALLFMFLAILEDSGYLSRAAFLMDRLLARVGLHGKSFIPLLSSFACAIPGIMATRTIEDRRDRLATILIAPFMSCSARLPVYALLIGTLFAPLSVGHPFKGALLQAGIMLGCYALGILAAVITAWVFKRSLLKGGATTFILELPSYKVPQVSQIAREVYHNAGAFVTKAGTTILAFSIVLWALAYYPRLPALATPTATATAAPANASPDPAAENSRAALQQEHSFAGRLGHAMEPAIKPLGFDWKMGIGLVGAFAARETFVSTMGITYAVGSIEGGTQPLSSAMLGDRYPDGRPVWTPLVGLSLLVWFVLALQCMSTVAIARRETGGWRWPIFMILYMNVLAYLCSLAVFQVGTHLGYA